MATAQDPPRETASSASGRALEDLLPIESFHDRINLIRQDLKYRYVPFRGYYRLRAYKYMYLRNREMRLLPFLVDRERNSLDVGANLGLFTYFLSRLSRRVHAFEPNPYPLRSLRAVIDANVTLHEVAVSDRAGETTLVVAKGPRGWTSNGASLQDVGHVRAARFDVPCRRIDDVDVGDVGFIKVDVEGHELAVLAGARETLARNRPNLFVENEVAHVGSGAAAVFDALGDLDYEGYAVVDGALTHLSRIDIERHQMRGGDRGAYVRNFIFLPKGRATAGLG